MSSCEDDYSSEEDEDYVPEGDASEGENSEDETDATTDNKPPTDADLGKEKEVDEIWEKFKTDATKQVEAKKNEVCSTSETSSATAKTKANGHDNVAETTPNKAENLSVEKQKDTVTITKVYDFAGEDVTVTKEVKRESKEAQTHLKQQQASLNKDAKSVGFLKKRPGGGIGSVLGKLGKKPKLSTLEKSKLDWNNYKTEEGINDELESYKKGKEGYLEKVQFLERTDMRQFDREREMRLGRSSKR